MQLPKKKYTYTAFEKRQNDYQTKCLDSSAQEKLADYYEEINKLKEKRDSLSNKLAVHREVLPDSKFKEYYRIMAKYEKVHLQITKMESDFVKFLRGE